MSENFFDKRTKNEWNLVCWHVQRQGLQEKAQNIKKRHIYRIYHIYFIYLHKRRKNGINSNIQEKDYRPERGHFQVSFGYGSTPGHESEEVDRKPARQDSGRV